MKYAIFIVILLNSFCSSCIDLEYSDGVPKCIRGSIRDFKREACKEITVDEYTFQNATVYFLNARRCCCDFGSAVIDNECNLLGVWGGFSGNQIINGEDFSNATYIRTIWER